MEKNVNAIVETSANVEDSMACPVECVVSQREKDVRLAALVYYYHPSITKLEEVEALLKEGANPASELIDDFNALQQIINSPNKGSNKLLDLLLNYTEDIHCGWAFRLIDGLLSSKSHRIDKVEECLKVALEHGLDINNYYFHSTYQMRSVNREFTPIYESLFLRAKASGNKEMMLMLRKYGAEPDLY